MAKNDNLQDFVTDIADTLRGALKKDSTHKINPQEFSGIITEIANGSTIETEDITITPSETVQEVSRTEGKYINKVTINPIQTESLDVVPTKSNQAIQAPDGKYYKEVNVGAVTSAIDSNITPTNIRLGISILGVEGNVAPDKPDQEKTIYPSEEEQTVMADSGHELAKVVVKAVEVESYEVMPSTSKQVVRASDGKWIKEVTVNPIQTETLSVTPTQSEQTIEAPQDKYYKEVNVGAVTSEIDPNITSENIRSGVSILGVQGNLEPDKPNQTKTVDPSTETQVVTADPGHELESVTVNAVTSSIDSNIIPENIRKDTTILGVTGTLEEGGGKASPEYVSFREYKGTSLDLSWLDTSNMTDMSNMFYYCEKVKRLDVSEFNTVKVTNMSNMFNDCRSLTSLDVSHFNTSKVTNMYGMFSSLYYALQNLDLSSFDTSNVTNMSNMFYACRGLKTLNISNFNTSNVTDMSYMFYDCDYLTSLDLSSFDTSNVTDMNNMFNSYGGLSLDLSNFNTSKVTDMNNMFGYCYNLTSVDLSSFDTSNVTNMRYLFRLDEKLKNITGILDLQSIDANSDWGNYFEGCSALEEVHIHNLGRNLSLSDSPKLTHDCLVELINNLQTVTSTKTLTLGSTNLAKLTDEEKQVATNKGWTLA